MSITLRSVMPQSAEESAAWDSFGLDSALDQCQDGESIRNEWPSEHGDSSGETFTILEGYVAPDGHTYNVLFTSDWGNYHAPWTDTHATLYRTDDPDDMAEFSADVAEWESKPELDPDYDPDEDEDSRFDVETDDVPNLDGMFPDELREWAENIPPSIPEPTRTALAAYAIFKAQAMRHRADGRISEALSIESQCDRIYRTLPEAYRW